MGRKVAFPDGASAKGKVLKERILGLKFAGCLGTPQALVHVSVPNQGLREASHLLGSYSTRSDLDLADLNPYCGPGQDYNFQSSPTLRLASLGAQPRHQLLDLKNAYPDIHVLILSGHLKQAIQWASQLGPGSLSCIGSRHYTRTERDDMRKSQRLLPLSEVGLETAVQSALAENQSAPLWVSIDLSVLQPHIVPGVKPVIPAGACLKALRTALELIPGQQVRGFEVVGIPENNEINLPTILTAIELLRDNILTWWGSTI